MRSALGNKVRALLFIGMVLTGLQFCFPLALKGAALAGAVDEISLRSTDPEVLLEGQDLVHDLALPTAYGLFVSVPTLDLLPTGRAHGDVDRTRISLLLVSGLHPSAP